ncbi:hypothetical protein [uncultured Psychroserpens sp.]|uniref:hypothetical protein n=1 Tax=uncultured Psychroserpens sp. TaxID=255436 RepID=UPI002627FBAA|nr:hypothetical protein [uncultured Psychroserpens sp.]
MVLTISNTYFWYSNWNYKFMIQRLLYILCCFVGLYASAQQEFHVFPIDHKSTPGTQNGTGHIDNPWDLQTAIQQKTKITSGDTIWLHEGIYNGRFVSTLQSLTPKSFITVAAFKDDKVVLNGNVPSSKTSVLEVRGQQIMFKDFEITFLGNFWRNATVEGFKSVSGISHNSGIDCKFVNLKIHNNPGSGIGSWKRAGGSEILDCIIYNNGYITKKGKGGGVGIYVQNASDEMRIIENNIIFNNFYKGVQIWSANKKAKESFVKNVELKNNAIFNNGSPAGTFKDNVIVGSGDRNGVNNPKHIRIFNNVLYHNTKVSDGQVSGDGASLTLGFHKNAPIEDVIARNNIVIGRNNALRILHAKSLIFENNMAYCGYLHLESSVLEHIKNWDFKDNTYYTKKQSSFRVLKDKDYSIERWRSDFGLDQNSTWKQVNTYDFEPVARLTKYKSRDRTYKVTALDENGDPVLTKFSGLGLKPGMTYSIYDVENLDTVLKSGTLSDDFVITFPMQQKEFIKPLHNTKARKTLSNFGVFIIEFNTEATTEVPVKKKDNAFKRFFKWLGF